MNFTLRIAAYSALATFFYAVPVPSAQAQLTIMPMGDSITAGVDYYTSTVGGYRDPLWRDLVASGISFTFVGVNNNTNNFGSATRALAAAGQDSNNGFGGYEIIDLYNNLDGNVAPVAGGAGNQGGYWLTGGGGTGRSAVTPNVILLQIGTNDFIQGSSAATAETNLNNLVTKIHTLTPSTIVLVAALCPAALDTALNPTIQTFNSYIQNTLVPSLSYTRFVDNYSPFVSGGAVNTLLFGTDNGLGVHPTRYGYPIIAADWAAAIRSLEGSNPTTYNVTVANGTVNNGASSGTFPAGSVVTVNSNAPTNGNQFASWSASTAAPTTALDNPFWQIATYIVPVAATTVTANYVTSGSPAIPNGTYDIIGGEDSYEFSWSSGPVGLSMAAGGTASGSLAQQQTYTGAANQQWTLTNLGNNVVELAVAGTTNALAAVGASTTAGANLDVETYTGATSQQWTVTQILGTTELVNVNSGLAVNIAGYSTQSGGQLDEYTAGYVNNQLWAFFPVTSGGSPPAAPTALITTAGNAQTALNWTASSNATSYNVYRGTSAGGESVTPIKTGLTASAYTDTGLTGGTTYYYKVGAVNASGTSAYSNEASDTPSAASTSQDINLTGYTMTFDDEFSSLSVTTASPKGSSTWFSGPANGATGDFSASNWNLNALSVSNGILSDQAYYANPPVNGQNWQSGELTSVDPTVQGFTQQYGYFEIRCQMPDAGTGAWPAFWLDTTSGITGGQNEEIDIFEYYGVCDTPGSYQALVSEASHNWNPDGSQNTTQPYIYAPQTPIPNGQYPWQGYHTYGCQIDPTHITWYIDGVQTNQIATPTSYITSPFYMMVDYALGGGWSLTGTPFPTDGSSSLQVDWVRVYSLPAGGSAPAAPTSLTATAGNAQAALIWTASSGATSYNVYRGTTAGGESTTAIATGITTTTYTNTGLTNGTTYYYKVAAVNSYGTSSYSNEASATPVGGSAPAAPTGLAATAGNAQAALSWTASSGATSYNVYRGTTAGGESTTAIATGITTTTYTNTGLTNGTTYYYKVAAVNSYGTSGYSNEASAVPTAGGGGTTTYYQDGFSRSGDMTGSTPDVTDTAGATWGNTAGTGQYPISGGVAAIATSAYSWSAEYLPVNGTSGITLDGTKNFTLSVVVTPGSTGLTGISLNTAAPGNLFDNDFAGLATCSGFAGAYAFNGGSINYNYASGITGATTISLAYNAAAATVTYTVGSTTVYTQTGVTAAQVAAIRYVALGDDGYGGGASTPAPTFDNFTFTVGSGTGSAPAAPTGLTATGGNAQMALSWTASTGATSYNVYRGTTAGGESTTAIATGITTTTYTNTGLANGMTFYYKVAAVNSYGTSGYSNEASGTTAGGTAPAAPTGLTATAGNAQAALSWAASTGATSYNVYRGTTSGGESTTAIATGITTTTYTNTGLTNGTTYYYKVAAVNSYGTSGYSNEASAAPTAPAAPGAPTGLTATGGNTQVVLNWTASSGATSYNVYRGNAAGAENTTAIATGITTTSYTNTGLPNSATYYYKVVAVNSYGNSGYSNEASATTGSAPAAPTSLKAVAGVAQVALSWTASSGATSYNVYRGTTAGGESTTAIATGVTTTSYTDTGLTVGTTYYYKVAAVNIHGTSAYSNEASAVPVGGTAPAAPTGLTATGGNTQVVLSWTASSGATSYNVYRGNAAGAENTTAIATGITTTTYTNSGLPNSATFYYKVVAVNSYGNSGYSNEASATTASAPAAPTSLKAVAGNAQAVLSWTASSGATSYNVYRGTTAGGESTTAIATGITTTGYTDTGLINGTTYYYKVAAVNTHGTSGYSNEASAVPVGSGAPAAPTGLTATGGNTQVVLSWTASSGATSYNVYRGTTAGGESTTAIATGITTTSYTNTGLTNGTAYYYKVAAVNSSGTSGYSNEASATPGTAPAAPTSLIAVPGNAQAALSWTASSGATSYNVYRGTTAGGESTTAIATGITTTTYTNTGLTNGTTYYYKVAAVNSYGTSGYSNEASATPGTAPAAPTSLIAVPGNAQAALSWTASSGATSYNVYRGTTAGGESTTAIATGITTTSYTNTGLTNGTTYYYKVAAVNSYGTSGYSNESSATPGTAAAAPTGLTATAGNAQAALSWTASTGATSYNIYRGTTAGGESATAIATGITTTSYTNTGLTNGTTYYYKVAAVNSYGTSGYSNEASAAPVGGSAPAAPTGLAATAGNAQVALSWTASTGATSYNVYRGTTAGGESTTALATGIATTSYTDSGLTNGTTYYYKVAAVNTYGTSGYSNEASAAPTAGGATVVTSVQFPQYYNNGIVAPMNGNNYTGGVVPVQNWSVADTNTGTSPSSNANLVNSSGAALGSSILIDSTGANTTIGFTYSGYTTNDGTNNTAFPGAIWYQTGGLADGDIAAGSSFNTTGTAETLSLTGLTSSHAYNVIVYVTAPWWYNSGSNSASINSGSTTYYITTSNTLGTWTQSSSTTAGSPTIGNYVKFSNVSGVTSQTITVTGAYVGLAGFQIVDLSASGGSAPSAPAGLTATGGNAQVALSWTAGSGATSYNVYRGTTAGGESTTAVATGITTTSYTDTGLANGMTFYYKVVAVNSYGSSGNSNEASAATTGGTAPGAPTSLTATAGNTQAALSWTASTGATSYNVYRGTTAGGESTTAIATGITTTTYTNTGLTNGTTYYYKVAAVNASGTSGYSNEASAAPVGGSAPAAPTSLTATAGNAQVTLGWTASTGATSYSVYRGTATGGEGATAIASGISSTSYTDTGLTNGTTYYYKIAAVNSYGTSGYSNEASAAPTASGGTTYALTVTDGNGTGSYVSGTVLTITASTLPGYQFAGWIQSYSSPGSLANSSAATTTFTTGAGTATLTATYTPVGGTTYALTVNGGSGSGNYPAGTIVTVTASAAPNGSQFVRWLGSTSALVLSNADSATTTISMPPTATTITSSYGVIAPTYAVTVTGGVINNDTGSGHYPAGTVLSVTANTPTSGNQFTGWTGTTSALANSSFSTTNVTVPAAAVAITANYATITSTYALTVSSGTGGGTYAPGTPVAVTANAPATGYQFAGWTGSTSALSNAAAPSTTFNTGSAAATITATYTPISSAGTLVLAVGLERIVTGYNGPAIRIQRPSDNTQMDIGFASGSNLLDMSAVSTFLSQSQGWITTLYAQDGSGHNVGTPLPTSTASMPTISVTDPTSISINGTSALTARNVEQIYQYMQGNFRYFVLPPSVSVNKSQMSAFLAYRPDFSGSGSGDPYQSLYEVGNPTTDAVDVMSTAGGLQGLTHNSAVTFLNTDILPRSQGTVLGLATSPGAIPTIYLDGVAHSAVSNFATTTIPSSVTCSGGYLLAGTGTGLYYGIPLFAQYNFLGFALYSGTVSASTASTISSTMLPRTIPSYNIVADGDSITQGTGSIYGYNMLHYVEPLLSHPADITNMAIYGTTSPSAVGHASSPTAAASNLGMLYNASYAKNIYYVDIGTNDIHGGFATGAGTWAEVMQALQDAKAMGYKTIVTTLLHETGETSSQSAEIDNFNALARAAVGQSYLDAIIDYQADPRLGNTGIYYQTYSGDGTHPNDAGYQVMSTIAAPVFNSLIGP